MTARKIIVLALVATAGCSVPRPCSQPTFNTAPGHATPPIGIVCHG